MLDLAVLGVVDRNAHFPVLGLVAVRPQLLHVHGPAIRRRTAKANPDASQLVTLPDFPELLWTGESWLSAELCTMKQLV